MQFNYKHTLFSYVNTHFHLFIQVIACLDRRNRIIELGGHVCTITNIH